MAGLLSSLRVRLVALVLIAALPAFGLIVWTSLEERQNERDHAEASATSLAQVVAGQQGQLVEGTRQLLGVLAALSPQSINTGTNQQVNTESCGRPLSAILALDKRYANIGIATNGQTVCSGVPISAPIDATDRPWYKQVTQTKQFAMGTYQVGKITGKSSINFAYPVLNADSQIIVIFYAAIDLDWLNGEVVKTKLSKDTTLTLIDRDGVVLAQVPDPATWVGKSISDRPIGRAVLSQGEGSGEFKGLDGKQRLFAFAPFGGTTTDDAYVAIGISTASAYAGINRALYRNLSLLGVATLLALAAAWFLGDKLVLSGLRSLTRTADRLRAGDLSARTELHGGTAEVTSLAHSFDAMAQTLEQRDTERKAAEEAMQQSEERFRSLVENAADGVVMVDGDARIVLANPASQRMFGYGPDELIGQPIEVLIPQRVRSEHEGHRSSYLSSAETRPMGAGLELYAVRRDGSEFPVDISLTPLETADGRLVAGTVKDITERKLAEAELAQRAGELAR
jgi:PAS domain S-box-containing protein